MKTITRAVRTRLKPLHREHGWILARVEGGGRHSEGLAIVIWEHIWREFKPEEPDGEAAAEVAFGRSRCRVEIFAFKV